MSFRRSGNSRWSRRDALIGDSATLGSLSREHETYADAIPMMNFFTDEDPGPVTRFAVMSESSFWSASESALRKKRRPPDSSAVFSVVYSV